MIETRFVRVFSFCIAGVLALASLAVILLVIVRGQDLSEVMDLVGMAGMAIATCGFLSIVTVRWAVKSIRGGFGPERPDYLKVWAVGLGILVAGFWALAQVPQGIPGGFIGVLATGIVIVAGSYKVPEVLLPDYKRFALNMSLMGIVFGTLAGWQVGSFLLPSGNLALGTSLVLGVLAGTLLVIPLSRQEQAEDSGAHASD